MISPGIDQDFTKSHTQEEKQSSFTVCVIVGWDASPKVA
jgi:hypothetical protein